jgi:hypothetical protein
MKKVAVVFLFLIALRDDARTFGSPLRFQKVSDHCFCLQFGDDGENVAAIVTDAGILFMDPPAEPDLTPMVEALRRLSLKPVRWVVFSNPRSAFSGGGRFFAEQGALLIGGAKLRTIYNSLATAETAKPTVDLFSFPWIVFEKEIHLYPSDIEIHVMALQHKAVTGEDVILYIPAEKVVLAGRVYEPGRYPDIDIAAQGNAGEWVDGLKQLVDSIPVLKPAIPQAKVESSTEPEKTLEEGIAVIPARGEISNLQNVKDLLEASQKLRSEIARAVKAGRSCENIINSSRMDAYRSFANFDAYATQLCESFRH